MTDQPQPFHVPVDLDQVRDQAHRERIEKGEDEAVLTRYAGNRKKVEQPASVSEALPLPEYVTPKEGVPQVGALSAEAMVRDFEDTAKHIEIMAAELAAEARKCAEELSSLANKFKEMDAEVRSVIDHIKDTAASFRDEAKTVFVRIENTALMTRDVRDASTKMRQCIIGRAPTATATANLGRFLDDIDKSLQQSEEGK